MTVRRLTIPALVFVLISLVLISCDKREVKIPTGPEDISTKDAKWALCFFYDDYLTRDNHYSIFLLPTNHQTSPEYLDDSVYVMVDTTRINLSYFGGTFWRSDSTAYLAIDSNIRLFYNGNSLLNTTAKRINPANVNFPATYDYRYPLTLNWGKSGDNEYQFVRAVSYSEGTGPYKTYEKRIANNAGSYTFPANCVSPLPDTTETTEYYLAVEQVNYKIVNKIAVMIYQDRIEDYGLLEQRSSENAVEQTQRILNHFIHN